MNKRVIYTAIFGNRDRLKEPVAKIPETDYVCFADTAQAASAWNVIVERPRLDPRMGARKIKILSHLYFPDHEQSVWVDGSMAVKAFKFSDLPCPLMAFRHPKRDCAYDEMLECARLGFDRRGILLGQAARYRQAGYPAHDGLFETGFLFRANIGPVKRFCEAWWAEVSRWSLRDQCSAGYAAWRSSVPIAGIEVDRSECYEYVGHQG